MKFELTDERKEKLTNRIKTYFEKELEVRLSDFQINQFIAFLQKEISPTIYNQAINDTESFIKDKLTDLEGDLKEDESA